MRNKALQEYLQEVLDGFPPNVKKVFTPILHQLWGSLPFLILINVYTPLRNKELGDGLA